MIKISRPGTIDSVFRATLLDPDCRQTRSRCRNGIHFQHKDMSESIVAQPRRRAGADKSLPNGPSLPVRCHLAAQSPFSGNQGPRD